MLATSASGSGTMKSRKNSGNQAARKAPAPPNSSSSAASSGIWLPTWNMMMSCAPPSANSSIARPSIGQPQAGRGDVAASAIVLPAQHQQRQAQRPG
jgi:hypothetical protein